MSRFDLSKTASDFKSGGGDNTNSVGGIFVGIVKEVSDNNQRMGRLRVWIPELGPMGGIDTGAENDQRFWYTMSYASPFAGATPVEDNKEGSDWTATQTSYGMWMVPPHVGNEVLCCFANGDTSRGFWFACLFQQHMNHMVPAIGAEPGGSAPVAEYNKLIEQTDYANPSRPIFSPLNDGLTTQGLISDTRRGLATTSARRESPSHVFGFSTPRGNTIHIDDGEGDDSVAGERDNEFIRFRTRSGVGITIHETDGFIYMVSRNGKSYIEISDNGVNLYSEASVDLRSTSGYNIHSDGDINIDAGGNLNIMATGRIAMGSPGDVHISAGGDLITGANGNASMRAGGELLLSSGGVMGLSAGGNSIRQGAMIQDGVDAPIAPTPLAPTRGDLPDGPGGTLTGSSSVGSMPHHEPRSGGMGNGGGEPMAPGDFPTTAEKKRLWNVMYAEMRRLGWSDTGAKVMIAQIGRENDYNRNLIFGSHTDPANRARNSGMISWQGSRGTKLNQFLYSKGAMESSGAMKRDDANIRAQIQFMDQEMRQSYRESYAAVRSNKSYRDIEYTTSTGYIAWRRNDPSYSHHLTKLDRYYTTIDGSIKANG